MCDVQQVASGLVLLALVVAPRSERQEHEMIDGHGRCVLVDGRGRYSSVDLEPVR